jgi:diguanylate cyclase (GGDEF)-like protein
MTTVDGPLLGDLVPQLRGSRILLISDRPADAAAISDVLLSAEFACVTEPPGPGDPDDVLQRLRPDLVVLDLASASPGELALLRNLSAAALGRPFLPVLVTGEGVSSAKAEVLAAGADDVAPKPLVAEELLARVRNLLVMRSLHRQQRELSRQSDMPAQRSAVGHESFLEAVIAHLDEAVLACDENGRIRFANDAANRLGLGALMPGRQPALAPGRLQSPDGRELALEEDPLHRAWTGEDVVDQLVVIGTPQHGVRTLLANARPVRAAPDRHLGAVVSLHDVTEWHRLTEELRRGLLEDELTGLPNTVLFLDIANRAVAKTARDHQPLSFIVIALDGVDELSDHDATGGPLPFYPALAALAERLPRLLRPGDVAARHGDGFVLLCGAPVYDSNARHIVQRLQVGLGRPLEVSRRRVTPHLSFGMATTYDANRSAQTLIEIAVADALRGRSRGGGPESAAHEARSTGW